MEIIYENTLLGELVITIKENKVVALEFGREAEVEKEKPSSSLGRQEEKGRSTFRGQKEESTFLGKEKEKERTPLGKQVSEELQEYFLGRRKAFTFPISLEGTEFQKKVWKALTQIPYGETRTYKEIAVQVGNPKAYRAVGNANNKNPLAIVVPCHRVVGAKGNLVGYAGGLEKKNWLLELERANLERG